MPDQGFGPFLWIFMAFFVVVLAIIVGTIASAGRKWYLNSKQPIITEPARVLAKRTNVSSSSSATSRTVMVGDQMRVESGPMSTSSDTTYYVTFELATTTRTELVVKGADYGMVVEGDVGMLTHQGWLMKSFTRTPGALWPPPGVTPAIGAD